MISEFILKIPTNNNPYIYIMLLFRKFVSKVHIFSEKQTHFAIYFYLNITNVLINEMTSNTNAHQ